jgi:type II secretory pathway component PulF
MFWIEIQERASDLFLNFMSYFVRFRFSNSLRIEFYRTLVLLYRNNSSLLESLVDIAANYSDDGKKRFNPVAMAAKECAAAVENGDKLSSRLVNWVPEQEYQLIAAGELSGSLPDGLRRAIESVQQSEKIHKAVSKLGYPMMLMGGIGYLLKQVSTTIVPQMEKMGSPDTWTLEGRVLKILAEIVLTFGYTGTIAIIVLAVASILTLPYFTGPIRIFLDRLPPWSFYKAIKGSDFLLRVTMLQGSSTSLELALRKIGEMSSPWLRERAEAVELGVKNGLSFGHALQQSGYDFPNREAIRYLMTISGKDGSKRNIEQFARDWNDATLERVDKFVNRSVDVGIIVFYGIVYLIWASMNGVMNNMLNSMPGM